jgi:hypothetical protein
MFRGCILWSRRRQSYVWQGEKCKYVAGVIVLNVEHGHVVYERLADFSRVYGSHRDLHFGEPYFGDLAGDEVAGTAATIFMGHGSDILRRGVGGMNGDDKIVRLTGVKVCDLAYYRQMGRSGSKEAAAAGRGRDGQFGGRQREGYGEIGRVKPAGW